MPRAVVDRLICKSSAVLGGDGDKVIVAAQPVDETDPQFKVAAIAEVGVGKKIAVADDNNALLQGD